jgi:benzil reductase ((S)-benzoin forming)
MDQHHLYIVTGASRGLGRAMAEQLAAGGAIVLGLSRQTPPAAFEQWPCDLADPVPVAQRLGAWLAGFDAKRFASASLINNAAMLTEPAPLADVDLAALSRAARVGLEAPLVLTAAFLRATHEWTGQRRVLHISSGLGRRGMASSGPYCAVKAGLDNLARAQALEEALQANGAKVCSLAPGIIDTDMQVQLRGADAKAFPDREAFVQFKSGGALDRPAAAAAKVIAYLHRADFGSNPVGDVRDA